MTEENRLIRVKSLHTGGTSDALDGIDGAVLQAREFCFVMPGDPGGNLHYVYEAIESGATPAFPDCIPPATNPGNWRWHLRASWVAENLRPVAALTADHSVSGIIATEQVGEGAVFGDQLYRKADGKLWKADKAAAGTMPVVAMAAATIAPDAFGQVLKLGYARDDSWNWTLGGSAGLIYASTAGGLTQTRPTSGKIQIVAIATHADRLFFCPKAMEPDIPATTAENDFQVGDGNGNWVKKTLAEIFALVETIPIGHLSGLFVSRKSNTEVNVSGGSIEINGKLCRSEAVLTGAGGSLNETYSSQNLVPVSSVTSDTDVSCLYDGQTGTETGWVQIQSHNVVVDLGTTKLLGKFRVYTVFGADRIKISTSSDGENWTEQVDQSYPADGWSEFTVSTAARYVKFHGNPPYGTSCTEIEIYELNGAYATHFVYIDVPAEGDEISSENVVLSFDQPVPDSARAGWYHPTDIALRAIGVFMLDGSGYVPTDTTMYINFSNLILSMGSLAYNVDFLVPSVKATRTFIDTRPQPIQVMLFDRETDVVTGAIADHIVQPSEVGKQIINGFFASYFAGETGTAAYSAGLEKEVIHGASNTGWTITVSEGNVTITWDTTGTDPDIRDAIDSVKVGDFAWLEDYTGTAGNMDGFQVAAVGAGYITGVASAHVAESGYKGTLHLWIEREVLYFDDEEGGEMANALALITGLGDYATLALGDYLWFYAEHTYSTAPKGLNMGCEIQKPSA